MGDGKRSSSLLLSFFFFFACVGVSVKKNKKKKCERLQRFFLGGRKRGAHFFADKKEWKGKEGREIMRKKKKTPAIKALISSDTATTE